MQTFDGIMAARNAIMDFRADHGAEIPEHLRPRFRELSASPSPVDQIVGLGEFIYANRESLTAPALSLGGGLIAFATTYAWHGLLENDRGNAIVQNLRKALGEISSTNLAAPEPRPGALIEAPKDEGEVEAEPEAPAA